MLKQSVLILVFVSSLVFAQVKLEQTQSCRKLCDGKPGCKDAKDEVCLSDETANFTRGNGGNCNNKQWQCRDGSCISFDGRCDGVVNCADGSDETHALCRLSQCQPHWFKCTYGACVDGTAPCNGIQECADNSDELLPICRNEVSEVRGVFRCRSGGVIPALLHCDGKPDCPDGSDETVRACAGKSCAEYLFQCAYGACVDAGSDCNGVKECYDGSDESEELCNRNTTPTVLPPITPTLDKSCVLPPFPKHGSYVVLSNYSSVPGMAFDNIHLSIICNAGYDIVGRKERICSQGTWSAEITDCVRFCRLNKDPRVEYECLVEGNIKGVRVCQEYEPEGTSVRPLCSQNHYSIEILKNMQCTSGKWSDIPHCVPGVTKNGTNITILIREENQYEVHVGKFPYTGPGTQNSGDISSTVANNVRPNRPTNPNPDVLVSTNPGTQQATPITPNDVDYDIDVEDWRIGPGTTVSPKASSMNSNVDIKGEVTNTNYDANKSNKGSLDLKVNNTRVVVKNETVQVYDKDSIVFRN